MSRICDLTGKKANNSYDVSHSHRRTKRLQHVNLQDKRVWWEGGKRFVKLRLSTKAIKTLDKKGLEAMAKEAGINLNKY
jgi:large subunit ribosomal protein L28